MIKKRSSIGPWMLVLACILTAVFVYYYKHRYQPVTKEILIKLDWSKKPDDLKLATKVLEHISVQVKAKKYIIEQLVGQERVYPIDFSKTQTGMVFMPIDPIRFNFPDGVNVKTIKPNALSFRLERIVEKEIPVRLTVSGTPDDTCVLSEIYLKPAIIVYNGPEHLIKDLKEIYTRSLSLNDVYESFSKELPLEIDESIVPFVSMRIVRVDVTLNEKIETQEYKNITVRGKNTKYRYKIRPSNVDLTFEGKIQALKELKPESINVYVNLKSLKPGVYARRVKIEVPGNVSLTDVRPEVFTVTLFKRR